MTDHKRLFIGVRLSVPAANALSSAVETLARRTRDAGIELRWVAPVNYHVTLVFLGNTRVDAITAVRDAMARATSGPQATPFSIKTARLGAFPSLEKPRILWAGIAGAELDALAACLRGELAPRGFADRKPFHAHVTIARVVADDARVKEVPGKLASLEEVVLPLSEQMFGDTRVDAITLFESETKSTGSVYREIHRAPFKTSENRAPESAKRQTSELSVGAREQDAETADPATETDDGWPRGHIPIG